jgi:glycosyltransferase involved in cell wall biosynthesis
MTAPLVSIGFPVYNGERYMAQALDSLLGQELTDFELIISDNASEDATREIALDYAARDDRVRYHRNQRNLGLARNFNRVFELSSGRYFKWAAHDDWHGKESLRVCADVLERDPSAVLCATAVAIVDEDGRVFSEWYPSLDLRSRDPRVRLHRMLWYTGETHALFALMRADALRRTRLMRSYVGSDRVLLSELALAGSMREIPQVLHFYRAPRLRPKELGPPPKAPRPSLVYDPANRGRLPLRTWRLCYEHLALVVRARVQPTRKLWLMADVLARFGVRDSRRLAAEVYHSGRIVMSRVTSSMTTGRSSQSGGAV